MSSLGIACQLNTYSTYFRNGSRRIGLDVFAVGEGLLLLADAFCGTRKITLSQTKMQREITMLVWL